MSADPSILASQLDPDALGHAQLRDAVHRLARAQDLQPTEMKGVSAYRSESATPPEVAVYKLGLCVAVQGRKRVLFGSEALDYGPMSGLVVGLPLPLQAHVVEASADAPCLAMVVEIEPGLVRETADALEEVDCPRSSAPALRQIPVTGGLLDALIRIARAAASETDAHMLGENLKRELVYRVLCTDQEQVLRSLADDVSSAHRLEGVIRTMTRNLASPMSVSEMAEEAHMCPSSFHQAFKHATSMTPLQYVKRMRLQAARALMLDSSLNASEAAHEVGYKSASQFSREFKALYGIPPGRCRSAERAGL